MARAGRNPLGHVGYGWLAAVLPAEARRVRAPDPQLASVLADAGAELAEERVDVELVAPGRFCGEADAAILILGGVPPLSGSITRRYLRRVGLFLAQTGRARRAARLAVGRGFRTSTARRWDIRHPIEIPGLPPPAHRSLVQRLPQGMLVVARRSGSSPTLFEAAMEAAGAATGSALRPEWPSVRAGLLVAMDGRGVLRVAVGPARSQLHDQMAALEELRRHDPPPLVSDRVPWPLASGRTGLADWSLERRVAGGRPTELSEALLEDCLGFLVALGSIRGDGQRPLSLIEQAETLASALGPDEAAAVRALADRLERALEGIPRCFGHGDFFAGNLLTRDGRLTGVVDWEGAGPARLPLVDLIHLRQSGDGRRKDLDWGPTLVSELLPWARGGGDELSGAYCARVGLDAGPELLEQLVLAYWLERAAFQVRTYPTRRHQPAWLQRNLRFVLAAVTTDGR